MCTRACPVLVSVLVWRWHSLPAAPICPPRLLKLTVEVGWHLHNVHATGTRRQGGEGRVGQSCTSMPCGSPTGSETGGGWSARALHSAHASFPWSEEQLHIGALYSHLRLFCLQQSDCIFVLYNVPPCTLSKLSSLYCALVWLLWSPELNMAASNSLPAQTTQPASINHPLYTSNVALFINSGPDSVGYKQCHTGIKCT